MLQSLGKIETGSVLWTTGIIFNWAEFVTKRVKDVQFLNLKSTHLTVQTIFFITSHVKSLDKASERFLL